MDARTQAMFAEAARQRDSFANLCINLRGELALVTEERDKARALVIERAKELEELKHPSQVDNVTELRQQEANPDRRGDVKPTHQGEMNG